MSSELGDLNELAQKPTTSIGTLFVALFLILLTFFILLNSISAQNRKKEGQAMESLRDTFDSSATNEPGIQYETPTDAEDLIKVYFTQMQSIVASDAVETYIIGNRMYAVIPKEVFFSPNTAVLRPDKAEFFERMVRVLKQPGENRNYVFHVEFVIGSKHYLADAGMGSNAQETRFDIARAGAFARELYNQYVMPEQMAIGLSSATAEQVILTFEVRPKDSIGPGVPLGELASLQKNPFPSGVRMSWMPEAPEPLAVKPIMLSQ
ncbi:MAG: PPE-repeat protein (cell mobility) [Rickettsiales bacterium]|jgi:hypothetical protein|nr:PPE-repeat protein (cell mobility) [Rickettsiales bacterium]